MNLFTLALAPVLAIFFFFYAKDRYEREPLLRLLLTALVGVGTALPVVVVEMLWGHTTMDLSALSTGEMAFMAFVEVSLTEEFFKGLAFFIMAYWSRHFNEPYDGIMYSVAAALGFAGLENIGYVLSGGIPTAFIRAVTAVPAHAMFGLFIGYFAGRAKFLKSGSAGGKVLLILAGFTISVFLHGLYDFIAFIGSFDGSLVWLWIFPLLAVMVAISFILIKDARDRSPFKPARDEFGRYTGYTVSGIPLAPKIARKLKVDMSHIHHDQQPEYPQDKLESSSSDEQSSKPYFLDEYFKPSRKSGPREVEDNQPPDKSGPPEAPDETTRFLHDYYNRGDKK